MWRQSKLLDLKLWQAACQGAQPSSEVLLNIPGARYGHSAGKRKVAQLERQLSKLQTTTLEHLQEQIRQVRQKVKVLPTLAAAHKVLVREPMLQMVPCRPQQMQLQPQRHLRRRRIDLL